MTLFIIDLPCTAPYRKQEHHSSTELYNLDFICESYGLQSCGKKYIRKKWSHNSSWMAQHFQRPRLLIDELEKDGFRGAHGFFFAANDKDKLHFLMEHIRHNIPLVVRIGSGYGIFGTLFYFYPRAFITAHFITLLGYDDHAHVFYVYDPRISSEKNAQLPIGNFALPEKILLQEWNVGLFWHPNFYFAIEQKVGKTNVDTIQNTIL
ncbi:hypothetical protein HYW21_07775 [Candidatus Woesearchaeota archaeon]|nr:hypothetical protein [Candidatus Woesearchaeota archaeon]